MAPQRRIHLPSGFTLIELLVVVAILALLVAILLPSLARARQQAYQVKCAANLRTIGTGIFYYAIDHKDAIVNFQSEPAFHNPGRYWATQIAPYVKIQRSRAGSREGLLRCPAETDPPYIHITGPSAAQTATREDKIKADSGVGLPLGSRPPGRGGPQRMFRPLIEPVSYVGPCEFSAHSPFRKLAQLRRPGCQVLLTEARTQDNNLCFWWTRVRSDYRLGRRLDEPSFRRHYGGRSPTRNGANWLFADGHVKWHSRTNALDRMICCQRFGPNLVYADAPFAKDKCGELTQVGRGR